MTSSQNFPLIDAYLRQQHSCQISSRSCWNDGALDFFEEVATRPNNKKKNKNNNNKMISSDL